MSDRIKILAILAFFIPVILLLNNLLSADILLEEDFEGYSPEEKVWPPAGWTLVDGDTSGWAYSTFAHSGEYNATLNWDHVSTVDCWLISNAMVIPVLDGKLGFYYLNGGFEKKLSFKAGISTWVFFNFFAKTRMLSSSPCTRKVVFGLPVCSNQVSSSC